MATAVGCWPCAIGKRWRERKGKAGGKEKEEGSTESECQSTNVSMSSPSSHSSPQSPWKQSPGIRRLFSLKYKARNHDAIPISLNDIKDKPALIQAQPDARTLGNYKCVSVIGKGSFGKVFLASSPRGSLVAVKVLPKFSLVSERKKRLVMDEKRVMIACGSHPFILALVETFQTKDALCLVSEFCAGGELFYHLEKAGRFTESQVRFYCSEILHALQHLHKHSIAYRDLKSENILLDHLGHIRLADFGLAAPNVQEWKGAKSICGTPAYIAPEMIRHGGKSARPGFGYGYSVDYWSLGTLMYDFLCGQPPFYDPDMEEMCTKLLSKRLEFPVRIPLSEEARDVISKLLRRNPEVRLGSSLAGGVQAIMEHPFFASVCWGTLAEDNRFPAPVSLRSLRRVKSLVLPAAQEQSPSQPLNSVASCQSVLETTGSPCQMFGEEAFPVDQVLLNFHTDFTHLPVEENLQLPPAKAPSKRAPTYNPLSGKNSNASKGGRPIPNALEDWDWIAPTTPDARFFELVGAGSAVPVIPGSPFALASV